MNKKRNCEQDVQSQLTNLRKLIDLKDLEMKENEENEDRRRNDSTEEKTLKNKRE